MTEIQVVVEDRTLGARRAMQWAVLTEYTVGSAVWRPGWRSAVHIIDIRWLDGNYTRNTDHYGDKYG